MKRTAPSNVLVLAAALALGAVGAARAQPPSGQWWILHQEVAKPSQVAAYEANAKEFKALVEANRAAMPTFYYTALQGDDFTYTYALRIKNFAGLDTINAEFGALFQAAGAKAGELMQRGSAATDHWADVVVGEEPSMGYMPATPRLKPQDASFFHYTLYFIIPGKEEEAKSVAAEYGALFKKHNVPNGYRVYWAQTGPDLPLLVVEEWAKDEADYYTSRAATMAAVGEASRPVDQHSLSITRRIETKSAWLRPDLSALPAGASKK